MIPLSHQMEIPLYWNDSRISLNSTVLEAYSEGKWYYIDPGWKEHLWFPTVIIERMQVGSLDKLLLSYDKVMYCLLLTYGQKLLHYA